MTWLNWSLKLHSWLRTIPHLIHTQHTCLMFNEYLIRLIILYMDQSKKIFDHFICFWKWFLSLFVFIFSAYFTFHSLNMFCVEKQVSKFFMTHSRLTKIFAIHLMTHLSRNPSCEFIQKTFATHSWLACDSLATRDSLATHSWLAKIFETRPVSPKNSFLKGFSSETYF